MPSECGEQYPGLLSERQGQFVKDLYSWPDNRLPIDESFTWSQQSRSPQEVSGYTALASSLL